MIFSIGEHLPDHSGTLANIFINYGTRHYLQEATIELTGDGSGQKGLTSAGWTVQQTSLWRLNADAQKQLGIEQWQLDDLA